MTKMGSFIRKYEGKGITKIMPVVDVVCSLITRDGKILAVYNDKWGAFTLPMTKMRSWSDPNAKEENERTEEWEEGAVRAAAEWLGTTLTKAPVMLMEIAEFQQSDRDATWKRYRTRVFEFEAGPEESPAPGKITQWLTADELVDEARRPISPTARHIIGEMKHANII